MSAFHGSGFAPRGLQMSDNSPLGEAMRLQVISISGATEGRKQVIDNQRFIEGI
jgi:hypothetical protein